MVIARKAPNSGSGASTRNPKSATAAAKASSAAIARPNVDRKTVRSHTPVAAEPTGATQKSASLVQLMPTPVAWPQQHLLEDLLVWQRKLRGTEFAVRSAPTSRPNPLA